MPKEPDASTNPPGSQFKPFTHTYLRQREQKRYSLPNSGICSAGIQSISEKNWTLGGVPIIAKTLALWLDKGERQQMTLCFCQTKEGANDRQPIRRDAIQADRGASSPRSAIWCGHRDSNPDDLGSRDFKSLASTNSAMPA